MNGEITISKILAIDPGNEKSGYTLIDMQTYVPIQHGKIDNDKLEELMLELDYEHLVLEMVASYGMSVGKSVFDTVFHTGRFSGIKTSVKYTRITRSQVKMHLLGRTSAKDTHITQFLVQRFLTTEEMDRWGDYGKGVKADKGYFYGFNNDIYQAYAVGVTWLDVTKQGKYNYDEVMDKKKKEKRKKK